MKRISPRVQYVDDKPSMTQQSFKDQCDIKKIIAKRQSLGIPLQIENDPFGGVVQDFSGSIDYRENLHKVMRAEQAFMALPAKLRQRFDNDPANLISFLEDDKNYDEAQKLGLLKADAKQQGKNDDKTTNNSPKPAAAPEPSPKA